MIRGCCEYQSIWDNPLVDGDLLGERETGNSHDPQAMHGYQEVINGTPAASYWELKKSIFIFQLNFSNTT